MTVNYIPSALVRLVVSSAQISSGFGGVHDGKWLIAHKVKIPSSDSLILGTGEAAQDIEMTLTVRERNQAHVAWATERTKEFLEADAQVHGLLYYFPEPGSQPVLVFEAFAPSDVVESLVRFARHGCHLSEVTLDVGGISYSGAPDGSRMRWEDNDSNRLLPITAVGYNLRAIADADHSPGAVAKSEGGLSELNGQLRAPKPLTPVGADLAPLLRDLLKLQRWTLWAIGAVAIALLFKG